MRELFKPIKNHENLYEISNFGRVKSLQRYWIAGKGAIRRKQETLLKPSPDTKGYLQVNLCKNGKSRRINIHHLVWDHFGEEPRNGHKLQIDHIDENKTNNHIFNLQLLTNRENCTKGKKQYKRTSKYTGVSWHKQVKKWRATIEIDKKQIHLGCFENEHDAHLAYQRALKPIKNSLDTSINGF